MSHGSYDLNLGSKNWFWLEILGREVGPISVTRTVHSDIIWPLDTFAEINQILLKIYLIHIISSFMYLVHNTLSENLVVNKSKSTQTQTQLIIVADFSNICFFATYSFT